MGAGAARQSNVFRAALAHLELAPFDSAAWVPALRQINSAISGRFVHLICRQPDRSGFLAAEMDSEEHGSPEWHAAGGTDPAQNSYMAATLSLRNGQDIIGEEIEPRFGTPNRGILDILRKNDGPHFCAMNVFADHGNAWYLGALHTSRHGAICGEDRSTFRRLGCAAGTAIRRTQAVRQHGAAILAGTLDALSLTAFVLNAFGQIVALTPTAEAMVRHRRLLTVCNRTLQARMPPAAIALDRAIRLVAQRTGRSHACGEDVVLTDSSDRLSAVAKVIPLPRDRCDIGLGAAALLIVEESSLSDRRSVFSTFDLTRAEAEVATMLLDRLHVSEIAERRGVSVETVRSQTKSVYIKTCVGGQRQLLAKFARPAG